MNIKNTLVSFLVGFIFAIGLAIAGMTQPSKVIGFLDIFGNWDPTLIFVLISAISFHTIAYHFIMKRKKPLFTTAFQVPQRKDLTSSLIIGSMIFGIGWGIGGYCPGPAITSFATFSTETLVLILSMVAGMYLYKFISPFLPLKK